MRTKIGAKIYDTDKSELIGEQIVGQYCSADGFEEKLYRKGPQDYFIYGLGGSLSPYPAETLLNLSLADATEWMQRILGLERASEILAADAQEIEELSSKKQAKAAAKKTAAKTGAKAASASAPAKKTAAKTTKVKK